jgi:hypothetical protein
MTWGAFLLALSALPLKWGDLRRGVGSDRLGQRRIRHPHHLFGHAVGL